MLIIPAAGLGARLRSTRPKPLVPVNGRPMLDWLLALYRDAVDRIIVIVHPSSANEIRAYGEATGAGLHYETQRTPTGMLDAILLGRRHMATCDAAHVWITWCDQVAVHPRTVERLAALSDANPQAPLVLPTVRRVDPYVHLERNPTGRIVRALSRREGDSLPPLGESEMGLFSLSRDAYLEALPEFARSVETGDATGERNFLPFIPWVAARGDVLTFPAVDEEEAVGINTPEDLRHVERYLETRRLKRSRS
ncbi:MAG: nucleotidyltransferase family protein [Vicinamibacterales bacterium]